MVFPVPKTHIIWIFDIQSTIFDSLQNVLLQLDSLCPMAVPSPVFHSLCFHECDFEKYKFIQKVWHGFILNENMNVCLTLVAVLALVPIQNTKTIKTRARVTRQTRVFCFHWLVRNCDSVWLLHNTSNNKQHLESKTKIK